MEQIFHYGQPTLDSVCTIFVGLISILLLGTPGLIFSLLAETLFQEYEDMKSTPGI